MMKHVAFAAAAIVLTLSAAVAQSDRPEPAREPRRATTLKPETPEPPEKWIERTIGDILSTPERILDPRPAAGPRQ